MNKAEKFGGIISSGSMHVDAHPEEIGASDYS